MPELGTTADFDLLLFVVTNMLDALSHAAVLRRPKHLSLPAAKEETVRAIVTYLRDRAALSVPRPKEKNGTLRICGKPGSVGARIFIARDRKNITSSDRSGISSLADTNYRRADTSNIIGRSRSSASSGRAVICSSVGPHSSR